MARPMKARTAVHSRSRPSTSKAKLNTDGLMPSAEARPPKKSPRARPSPPNT
ncbi:Uncharacterised protein [Bordetella pertussis]|nr:Uncharacterised protein [Bordetella pertussis]